MMLFSLPPVSTHASPFIINKNPLPWQQQLPAVLEAENLPRKTNSGFHRVSMLMLLELFPFHGGCPPVCLSLFSFGSILSFNTFLKFCFCPLQINHKYPERRLLVAESCGALAPYLPVRTVHTDLDRAVHVFR